MDLENNNESESLNQPVGVSSELETDLSIAGSPNTPQGDKLVRQLCSDKHESGSGIERLREKDVGLRTSSSVNNFRHRENEFLLSWFKLRYVLRHDRVLLCRRFCGP
jgi:hypothetical protein